MSTGGSLTLSLPGTVNVAVDPEPRIIQPIDPRSAVFAETSDDFFARHDLGGCFTGLPLDLALIDGMHNFEFALRDFMNIEQRADADTTILMHDCYLIDEQSAGRAQCPGEWSGDVWRLIVCLKEWRPDLKVSVADIGPTGLDIITGLDLDSKVLAERYDDLVEQCRQLPYRYLSDGDKAALLNRVPGDWASVQKLLLPRPFRSDPLAPWSPAGRWGPPCRWPAGGPSGWSETSGQRSRVPTRRGPRPGGGPDHAPGRARHSHRAASRLSLQARREPPDSSLRRVALTSIGCALAAGGLGRVGFEAAPCAA